MSNCSKDTKHNKKYQFNVTQIALLVSHYLLPSSYLLKDHLLFYLTLTVTYFIAQIIHTYRYIGTLTNMFATRIYFIP
jgi:hypothetical protein